MRARIRCVFKFARFCPDLDLHFSPNLFRKLRIVTPRFPSPRGKQYSIRTRDKKESEDIYLLFADFSERERES